MTILAANTWPTNAELIEDVARLHLGDVQIMVDPTYGRGVWWKKWRPPMLVSHDLAIDGVDFRELPHPSEHFDAAAFDPPYVSIGGRATSQMREMYERFGLLDAPRSPEDLQGLINSGLVEVRRVTRRGGLILVKCQDYISSGKLWAGTHRTLKFAESIGLELVDRFEHVAKRPRPQPSGRRQVHARRNLSTLLVLRRIDS
jgi:tRNA G10  N-methylase Trm11